MAEFGSLFADAVRRVERPGPTVLRLGLRPGPEVAARAARLAAAETRCCSFFAFTLRLTDGRVTLEVSVPPAHTAALDALATLGEVGVS